MQLGLSSDAAPDASVDELVATCARRGLAALELTIWPGLHADQLFRSFDRQGDTVRLTGLLSDDTLHAQRLASLSRSTGIPIILQTAGDLHTGIRHTRTIIDYGGEARLFVRGPAEQWLDQVVNAGLKFAWHVDDSCSDPGGDAERILQRTGEIEYVRLAGGGPETGTQEGRGIAPLMRALALASYSGPLILTPSSSKYRVIWSTWLGRRGGWGCGSKAESERPMVSIQP